MSESKYRSAINPYALAEQVIGRPIRWDQVFEDDRLLEACLQTPAEQLFDPAHASLLYAGHRLDADHNLTPIDDGELEQNLEELDIPGMPVPPELEMFELHPERVRETLRDLLTAPERQGPDDPWTPKQGEWKDVGDFFEEAAEPTDPKQGALGDCYLIAALSAVAWARQDLILHRTRRTDTGQQNFVDQIDFHKNGSTERIEVTERVPVRQGSDRCLYARSNEAGEIWPGVFEKAYAKWKTNNSTDQPDYRKISGGVGVFACAELTGGKASYNWTTSHSADDLWHMVRQHSAGNKTVHPMVASTYNSNRDAPGPVDYGAARLVACHVYTVLGWVYDSRTGSKYIVLRNPWGYRVPTSNVLTGRWSSWDETYGRSQALGTNGVFALESNTFKQYFEDLSYVTP